MCVCVNVCESVYVLQCAVRMCVYLCCDVSASVRVCACVIVVYVCV